MGDKERFCGLGFSGAIDTGCGAWVDNFGTSMTSRRSNVLPASSTGAEWGSSLLSGLLHPAAASYASSEVPEESGGHVQGRLWKISDRSMQVYSVRIGTNNYLKTMSTGGPNVPVAEGRDSLKKEKEDSRKRRKESSSSSQQGVDETEVKLEQELVAKDVDVCCDHPYEMDVVVIRLSNADGEVVGPVENT